MYACLCVCVCVLYKKKNLKLPAFESKLFKLNSCLNELNFFTLSLFTLHSSLSFFSSSSMHLKHIIIILKWIILYSIFYSIIMDPHNTSVNHHIDRMKERKKFHYFPSRNNVNISYTLLRKIFQVFKKNRYK